MPIIDSSQPVESTQDFWTNELQNTKILLFQVNLAIQALSIGGHKSYSIDSGQNRTTVTRNDIAELRLTREDLINTLADIETKLGINQPIKQLVPYW